MAKCSTCGTRYFFTPKCDCRSKRLARKAHFATSANHGTNSTIADDEYLSSTAFEGGRLSQPESLPFVDCSPRYSDSGSSSSCSTDSGSSSDSSSY